MGSVNKGEQDVTAMLAELVKRKDRLLSPREVAERLGVCTRTLRRMRIRGGGPAYCRVMSRAGVAYRPQDIDAFVAANTFRHTAEEATRG